MKQKTQAGNIGSLVALGLNIALLILATWIFFNRQFVLDSIALWGYNPPKAIVALANQTTMTDESRRYFYASRPTIDGRDTFTASCKNTDEQTIVLGCYVNREIHVFNVTDPRLPGVKAVTAAHEMLHAAYERLSDDEKAQIKILIGNELKGLKNDRIKKLIAIYNKTEPGELYNEMHSILATEADMLRPELEQYYYQYFTDRQAVVKLSAKYEAVFSDLRYRQDILVAELEMEASEINRRSADLNKNISQLNIDVQTFNNRAENGEFDTESQFNRQRDSLISRQAQLQTQRTEVKSLIASYEAKRAKLEAINLEAKSLNSSINSKLTPIPSVR